MTPHPHMMRQRNALLTDLSSPSGPLSSPRHPNGDILAGGDPNDKNNFLYAQKHPNEKGLMRNYYPSLRGQRRPPPTKSLLNGAILPDSVGHAKMNTPRNILSGDAHNGDRNKENGIAIDNNLVLMSSNGMTNGHAIPGS